MRKFSLFALCMSVMIMGNAIIVQAIGAECPPPEIGEYFLKSDNLGALKVYYVGEATEAHIGHIKYVYDRLLVRDDKAEGRIRAALERENPVLLVFEDEEDEIEFMGKYETVLESNNCSFQEFLLEEVLPLGSEASDLHIRDGTIEEMVNFIYAFGVRSAYPSYDKKLKKATTRAISAGVFRPLTLDKELEKPWWHFDYLGVGVEVYYGVWSKYENVMNGGYQFSSREAMQEGDPVLFELIEQIFPKNLYQ